MLLITAAYGIINANANWEVLSDTILISIGFCQRTLLPELFVLVGAKFTLAVVAKIVVDLLFTDLPASTDPIILEIKEKVMLGTTLHVPDHLRYLDINQYKLYAFCNTVDSDQKQVSINCMHISRLRRRELEAVLTSVDVKSFPFLNSTVGWIGKAASPFWAAFATPPRQLQAAPCAKIVTSYSKWQSCARSRRSATQFPSLSLLTYEITFYRYSSFWMITTQVRMGNSAT